MAWTLPCIKRYLLLFNITCCLYSISHAAQKTKWKNWNLQLEQRNKQKCYINNCQSIHITTCANANSHWHNFYSTIDRMSININWTTLFIFIVCFAKWIREEHRNLFDIWMFGLYFHMWTHLFKLAGFNELLDVHFLVAIFLFENFWCTLMILEIVKMIKRQEKDFLNSQFFNHFWHAIWNFIALFIFAISNFAEFQLYIVWFWVSLLDCEKKLILVHIVVIQKWHLCKMLNFLHGSVGMLEGKLLVIVFSNNNAHKLHLDIYTMHQKRFSNEICNISAFSDIITY